MAAVQESAVNSEHNEWTPIQRPTKDREGRKRKTNMNRKRRRGPRKERVKIKVNEMKHGEKMV